MSSEPLRIVWNVPMDDDPPRTVRASDLGPVAIRTTDSWVVVGLDGVAVKSSDGAAQLRQIAEWPVVFSPARAGNQP